MASPRSVDVVVGHEEAQVEGEVDERPQDGLQGQQHEAPHVVGDVVDVWNRFGSNVFL